MLHKSSQIIKCHGISSPFHNGVLSQLFVSPLGGIYDLITRKWFEGGNHTNHSSVLSTSLGDIWCIYFFQNIVLELTCTLRRKSTSKHLFRCFRLSQIEDSIQHLEGPNGIWKDHDRQIRGYQNVWL